MENKKPADNEKSANHPVRRAAAITFVRMIPLLLILTLIAAAALLLLPIFGKPLIQLTATSEKNASEMVLVETKDLFQLSSVEYMHKVVFPYDFLEPGLSYETVFKKLEESIGKVPPADLTASQRIAKAAETFLTPAEQLFALTANLANISGLVTSGVTEKPGTRGDRRNYDFLVATVVVKAGFDLAGTPFAQDQSGSSDFDQNGIDSWVTISEVTDEASGKKVKRIQINLPPAKITDVSIEDPIRDQYPFPDLNLTPEGWRKIADFVRSRAIGDDVAKELLDTARANASEFFRTLLTQAGYNEVKVFSDGVEIQPATLYSAK